MTIGTSHREVPTCEFVVTLYVVIEYILARNEVTILALVTQLLAMHIVFGVASDSGTILRRLCKALVGVALDALGHATMQPLQRPIGVFVVVKVHGLPNTGLVASITIVSESPHMQ